MRTYVQILTIALALSLLAAGPALADDAERRREVLSGGATESSAPGVSLRATLGQPLVGTVSGGVITLEQGFWHGGAAEYGIYLPLVMRN